MAADHLTGSPKLSWATLYLLHSSRPTGKALNAAAGGHGDRRGHSAVYQLTGRGGRIGLGLVERHKRALRVELLPDDVPVVKGGQERDAIGQGDQGHRSKTAGRWRDALRESIVGSGQFADRAVCPLSDVGGIDLARIENGPWGQNHPALAQRLHERTEARGERELLRPGLKLKVLQDQGIGVRRFLARRR